MIVIVPLIDRLARWYDVRIMIVIVIVPMSDRKQVGLSMSFSHDMFLSAVLSFHIATTVLCVRNQNSHCCGFSGACAEAARSLVVGRRGLTAWPGLPVCIARFTGLMGMVSRPVFVSLKFYSASVQGKGHLHKAPSHPAPLLHHVLWLSLWFRWALWYVMSILWLSLWLADERCDMWCLYYDCHYDWLMSAVICDVYIMIVIMIGRWVLWYVMSILWLSLSPWLAG